MGKKGEMISLRVTICVMAVEDCIHASIANSGRVVADSVIKEDHIEKVCRKNCKIKVLR